MPEKNLINHILPWITTLVLAAFATLAQYAAKVREGEPFSWRALALDLAICTFAAVVTHMLCEWYGTDGLLRSVLVAISAHSGTRAMMQYERLRDRVMGIDRSTS